MTDITKLKELAERATPGPWSCNRHWAIVGGPVLEFTNGAAQQQIAMACGQSWMHDEELRNNAEWIAAANPQAILGLIERLEKAEQHWANENSNNMALITEVERLRKDAAIGAAVWQFIDRMTDVCEQDTAERILEQFVAAVRPAIDAALEGGGR